MGSGESNGNCGKNGIVVKVPIGKKYIYKNSDLISTDTIALIKDNRTYLPIRAVLEAFNVEVYWDNSLQTVSVTSSMLPEVNSETKIALSIDGEVYVMANKYYRETEEQYFMPAEIYNYENDYYVGASECIEILACMDGNINYKKALDFPLRI